MIREGQGWTMHLGDMADVLPGLDRVDHVITDPPYSQHTHECSRIGASKDYVEPRRGAKNRRCEISRNKDLGFSHVTSEEISTLSREAARLCRRWCLIFCDVESAHLWVEAVVAPLRSMRVGAWIKVGGTPQFTGDRPAVGFEAIVISHPTGKARWNGGGKAGVWSCPIVLERGGNTDEPRLHTTQKPEALMEALVRDFTDPGETILDPFAGSGTTGVAALRNGRRFVGVEKDRHYFDVACKRLEQTREQLRLIA